MSIPGDVKSHPNTVAATVGGALGILITAILGWSGLDVTGEVGGAISTLCAAVLVLTSRILRRFVPGLAEPEPDAESE